MAYEIPTFKAPTFTPPSAAGFNSSRWVGLAEGAVLIGGTFVIERFGLVDLHALPIHPLTIVVALLAVQYGAVGGIVSASAATCLSVIGGSLPARVVGEDYYEYLATMWSMPLLWMLLAVLLGIISDTNLRALDKAHSELQALRQERDAISAQYDVLAQRARRLERIAAGFERKNVRQN